VGDTQVCDLCFYSTLVTPGGVTLSDSRKEEVLNDLETQFQLVTDSSVPAVIKDVDMAMNTFFKTAINETN
jgi:hypothetical protein